ncbi:MAG: universal stress protein [Clostridia bacterium]|nr:universal stress protein [Clostridia bacterium]
MNPFQNVLVCVTQQKTCERLIRKAVDLIGEQKGDLFVIHVAKNEWNFLDNDKEGEALEYLFSISKSIGANLYVLRSDDIVNTIVDFARDNRINYIVMGETRNDHKENYFYTELKKLMPNVEIHVISHDEI